MVRSAGKVLTEKASHHHDGNEPARIPDDRENNRRGEDRHFFPKAILREMTVDRRKHRDRHERTNSAATFVDGKVESLIRGVNRRSNGVDTDPEKVTDGARGRRFDELQFHRRLREKIQRHHEKETRSGKGGCAPHVCPRHKGRFRRAGTAVL